VHPIAIKSFATVYGGIAVLEWFYQLLFMSETKNRTLEEIDLIFETPTIMIVKENIRRSKETCKDLMHLRFVYSHIAHNVPSTVVTHA
jgi:hypothetical protein